MFFHKFVVYITASHLHLLLLLLLLAKCGGKLFSSFCFFFWVANSLQWNSISTTSTAWDAHWQHGLISQCHDNCGTPPVLVVVVVVVFMVSLACFRLGENITTSTTIKIGNQPAGVNQPSILKEFVLLIECLHRISMLQLKENELIRIYKPDTI